MCHSGIQDYSDRTMWKRIGRLAGIVPIYTRINRRSGRNDEVTDNIWDEFFHKNAMLPNREWAAGFAACPVPQIAPYFPRNSLSTEICIAEEWM